MCTFHSLSVLFICKSRNIEQVLNLIVVLFDGRLVKPYLHGMSDLSKQYCHCHKSGEICTARLRLHGALRTYFKFDDFRSGQLEATLPTMHQQDVFVRMATGSGKSICMFLPPLAISEQAMGVVISPLNTLMDQQVTK